MNDKQSQVMDELFGGIPLLADILIPALPYEDRTNPEKIGDLIELAFADGRLNDSHKLVVHIGIHTIGQRINSYNKKRRLSK